MNLTVKGKRALVCGSTQGIGKATAEVLAASGAGIVLFARDEEKLKATAASLPAADGLSHDYLVADFNNPGEVQEVLSGYLKNNPAIDLLINNSGGPPGGPANEADPEEFRIAFERHVISSQVITKLVIPGMRENNFGRIINIISTSVKAPIPGLGVSNTIRGAVANWSKTLSVELGPFGITVNNVLPGATMTGRLQSIIDRNAEKKGVTSDEISEQMMKEIPAGRFAAPEEVAYAVVYLCSEEAAYINGINLPVDGGRLPSL